MGYMFFDSEVPVVRSTPLVWVVGGSTPSRKGGGSDWFLFLLILSNEKSLMKPIPTSQRPLAVLMRLSKAFMESSIQFMSVDELEGSRKLSEAEFLVRVEKYVKDAEVDVPSDPMYKPLITGMLAKMYAKGLEPWVVKKYVLSIDVIPPAVKPLKFAAKKRKLAELRSKLKPIPAKA